MSHQPCYQSVTNGAGQPSSQRGNYNDNQHLVNHMSPTITNVVTTAALADHSNDAASTSTSNNTTGDNPSVYSVNTSTQNNKDVLKDSVETRGPAPEDDVLKHAINTKANRYMEVYK